MVLLPQNKYDRLNSGATLYPLFSLYGEMKSVNPVCRRERSEHEV
jgi:hypothetical protein